MYLPLDGNGSLQAQLKRALKTALVNGRLNAAAKLPSTRLLATELGVSRNTVLAAYEQLRAEGYVNGRTGSGSYVVQLKSNPLQSTKNNTRLPPQSDYAKRARAVHDHANIPGRSIPGVRYALQYGVPLTNPKLTSVWSVELARAARYTVPNYPVGQGQLELRLAISDYLNRRRGLQVGHEDILIIAGTQQAVDICAKVLLDNGDRVVMEEPHYFATREILHAHGARIICVPVDSEGLLCEALPIKPPQMICVTPSHQFPSGAVMSLSRREALLKYAAKNNCWIFEDDYDGEFRYDSPLLQSLRSIDSNDRVIYVGTFSKSLFPALRLGYLIMPRGLRDDFISAKWLSDFGSPAIEQMALAKFISSGRFERHLRESTNALKERRSALLHGLQKYAGQYIEVADSRAGMHIAVWLKGRTTADVNRLIKIAQQKGLGLYSAAPFYLRPIERACLLMGFASLSVVEIESAAKIFGDCLDELYN